MNKATEKQCNIICVNSIKGGAGKTTISLALACTLSSELEAKYNMIGRDFNKNGTGDNISPVQKPKICYIDFDILGTGAKHIIYGENYSGNNIKYFNNKSVDENYRQYINTLQMDGQATSIDCIIMNDNPEEKNKFINNARSHTSAVNINVFENRAKKLLDSIIQENGYDYIIIDCAPSYESFSRNIYGFLIKEMQPKHKQVKFVYNLFITTLDKAHVMNTVVFVRNIIDTAEDSLNLKIVVNDTLNYFKEEKEKKDFINRILDTYTSLRKKDIEECGNTYEPSLTTFNETSIVIKEYSEIAQNMIFGNGKQLNGTKLCSQYLDDRKLIRELKILF